MLIDTHAHLTDKKFPDDVGAVVKRAKKAGVEKIIVPGTGLRESKSVLELVKKTEGLYGLVGVHPEKIINNPKLEIEIDALVELIESSDKIVGIGEIGLDFYWDKDKKTVKEQVALFEMQLRVAEALCLPVAVHSRDADKEITEVLDSFDHLPRGHFHCWGGGEKFLKFVLKKGFYVSFCGNVTYPSADNLRKLAKSVPLDRLLLETDSPYLSPEGKRGARNEPANVRIIARFLADLLDKTEDELVEQTTQNARLLFDI